MSPAHFVVPALLALPVVVALALLVRGVFLGYPKAPLQASILSAKEQAILAAAADAFFPPGGPIPLSGTEAGVVPYMDRYIRRVDATQRFLIRLLIRFVEHGPWIFGPRPARFTRLRPAERIAVLGEMGTSRIYFRRISFLSLRVMMTMGYFANAQVSARIGSVPCAAPFEEEAHRAPLALGPEGAFA